MTMQAKQIGGNQNTIHNQFDELKLLQDSYMKIWQYFISCITWFANINLLAIGWVVTSQSPLPMLKILVALMEILIITTLISVIFMYSYSRRCQQLAALVELSKQELLKGIIPNNVTDFVCLAMGFTFVALGAAWGIMWAFRGVADQFRESFL